MPQFLSIGRVSTAVFTRVFRAFFELSVCIVCRDSELLLVLGYLVDGFEGEELWHWGKRNSVFWQILTFGCLFFNCLPCFRLFCQ
jgi:hypothetical protein